MPYLVGIKWYDYNKSVYEETREFETITDVEGFIAICKYIQGTTVTLSEEEAEEATSFSRKLSKGDELHFYELVAYNFLKSKIGSDELPEHKMRDIYRFFVDPRISETYEDFMARLNDETEEWYCFDSWYYNYNEELPDYLCEPDVQWVIKYDKPKADVSKRDWQAALEHMEHAMIDSN